MLIPIDNNVDVPHINTKNAARMINNLIFQFQDENHNRMLFNMIKEAAYRDTNTEEDARQYIKTYIDLQRKCNIALLSNNYTHLTADVCDMVAETQKTLKSWTIQDLHIEPNTSGIILFEKPKFTKETKISIDTEIKNTTQETLIVGLCWIYFTDQTIGKEPNTHQADILWVSPISRMPDEHKSTIVKYAFGGSEFVYEIFKDGTMHPLTKENGRGYYDKAVMDYLAATMMLVQQREIIAPPETYQPTAKRGKRRDPILVPTSNTTREPMKISTVSLSETVRKAYAANNAGTSTGQKPTKSWWVKGHWRRQPYGPGRTLRKLIYIHPHISGNVSAPLDDRKTITKVVP